MIYLKPYSETNWSLFLFVFVITNLFANSKAFGGRLEREFIGMGYNVVV